MLDFVVCVVSAAVHTLESTTKVLMAAGVHDVELQICALTRPTKDF